MFERLTKFGLGRREETSRTDLAAKGRWENEGGASVPVPAAVATTTVAAEAIHAQATSNALDARQVELMTMTSSDGRPPARWQRVLEWRWFGVGTMVLIFSTAIWMVITGVSGGAIAAGVAFGVLLLVGAIPVLGAGVLRGQEERSAHKRARTERQESRAR